MKTIWCNGTFDVLHYGHFKLLEYASSLGTLNVGIDSDRRVKEKKGIDRPFHSLNQRREILEGLRFVNKVYEFDSDDELTSIIQSISPDVMVIGSDYTDKKIIGSEYIKQIVYFSRLENLSTTNILNKWETINQ
jgi:rfaE bifunctional protein nucleotidyltransferase chain/domain